MHSAVKTAAGAGLGSKRGPARILLPAARPQGHRMSHPLLSVAKRVWPRLPRAVSESRTGQRVEQWLRNRYQVGALANLHAARAAPPRETRRRITTLAELDAQLRELDAAGAVSDDALRQGFTTFYMDFPWPLPANPDSAAYRDLQFRFYEWLHGKPYASSNEVSSFDVDQALRSPFPYCTRSAQTIGGQLIAIGHILRSFDLPAGASVLEFGPGWGNTTLQLARSGYRVTTIDIERNFVELIEKRARGENLDVDVRQGDFSAIHSLGQRYDGVLFFECFHHCDDPAALVAGLDAVVAPGGKVVFAAEPISDHFPMPWGLRLDGESLWAIRKNGWLELGFQETWFRGLLARHGWSLDKRVCGDSQWNTLFVATRTVA